jgi:hypothetical protein
MKGRVRVSVAGGETTVCSDHAGGRKGVDCASAWLARPRCWVSGCWAGLLGHVGEACSLGHGGLKRMRAEQGRPGWLLPRAALAFPISLLFQILFYFLNLDLFTLKASRPLEWVSMIDDNG